MNMLKKGDPIGEWLGRMLSPLINRFVLRTPEDNKRLLESTERDDPLRRLGMTQGPPEVWKSLLWWFIFLLGMGLVWYMSFQKR